MKSFFMLVTFFAFAAFAEPLVIETAPATAAFDPKTDHYLKHTSDFFANLIFPAKVLKVDGAAQTLIVEGSGAEYGAWQIHPKSPELLKDLKVGSRVIIKGLNGGSSDWIGDRQRGTVRCEANTLTLDKIADLANASTSHIDFLGKIPTAAADRFTFMRKSESLQADGASKDLPRVIRFSDDGKTTLAYVCDPKSKTYNEIEVLHFNDDTQSYTLEEIDFKTKTRDGRPLITKNPAVCVKCHGENPRPIWGDYDFWTGAFGADDDHDVNEAAAGTAENDYNPGPEGRKPPYFTTFKRKQRANPCYGSLPWPKDRPGDSFNTNFPYVPEKVEKPFDLNNRPNTHFTITQSRLNARRVAEMMLRSPGFKTYGSAFLGVALDCEDTKDLVRDRLLVPTKRSEIYAFMLTDLVGVPDTEWGLGFGASSGHQYNTGDFAMEDLIASVLLERLSAVHPELKPFLQTARVNAFLHGSPFKCIDDLASKIVLGASDRKQLCSMITTQAQADLGGVAKFKFAAEYSDSNYRAPKTYSAKVVPDGYKVMTNRCAKCHTSQFTEADFSTLESVRDVFKDHPGEKATLRDYVTSGFMPHDGTTLSPEEKAAVIEFVNGL